MTEDQQPVTGTEPGQAEPPAPPPPERYPFWEYSDVLLFAGLAIPSMLAAELLVKGTLALFHLHPAIKVVELLPAQFLGYILLFGGLWGIFRMKYERPLWRSLAWRPLAVPFSLAIVCGVLAAFGVGIASNLIHTPDTSNPMTELMQGRTALIVMAVFGVTLGPVFEELAFRGFLQPLLVRSVGRIAGVLLAAVPFGLLHYQEYGNSWRHALVISLAGAAFGTMKEATGSTKASALMHAAYNAFFFVVLFARKD
ncbi:MAG TPA: type II CAAX endopeptidase family protein [Bryobacteraceae bacterium]|nr:type II CAAX endopeptidase family protein [Bryobacteraceae bacterium]